MQMAKQQKDPSFSKKKKRTFIKENWCTCTTPKFNGDKLDHKCTMCGGDMV